MEQIYCITKQTYVVITLVCRGMGYVPFTRVLSWITICRQYALFGLFCADFYADIWDLTQILHRYLDQKSAAGSSDADYAEYEEFAEYIDFVEFAD